MNRSYHAVFLAAGKRDLELARQAVGQFLVEERKGDALCIGMHVEHFILEQAAQRARRDIAHRVVAGFARRQTGIGQPMQHVGNLRQRDEMILHVLARGEVALATSKLVGYAGKLIHLLRRQQAARNLCPDHVDAGLALRIHTPAEPLRAELVVVDLARYPLLGVGAEQLDVGPNGGVVLSFGGGGEIEIVYRFRSRHVNTSISIEITRFEG